MSLLNNAQSFEGYTINYLIKAAVCTETYKISDAQGQTLFLKLFVTGRMLPSMLTQYGVPKEIENCKHLDNDNIITYHDSGCAPIGKIRYYYMVTDYIDGSLLSEVLRREGCLESSTAIEITMGVLRGLQYIHSHGLVHNDITLRNIMLRNNSSKEPQIIDMSHLEHSACGSVSFITFDLEAPFRAPETFDGFFTPLSDIYSVGVMLFAMLYGRVPFANLIGEGMSPEEKKQILNNARTRTRMELPEQNAKGPIPEWLRKAVGKALDCNEYSRFESADQFLEYFNEKLKMQSTLDELLGCLDCYPTLVTDLCKDDDLPLPMGMDDYETQQQEQQDDDEEFDADSLFPNKCDDDKQDNEDDVDIDDDDDDDDESDPIEKLLQPEKSKAVFRRGSGNGFDDVAGMADLKKTLQIKVINVLKDKEKARRYRLKIPNGMLLYGPPGCGKTFIAEKFAEQTGFNFSLVKSSDLSSTFVHGSQQMIADLFVEAEKRVPVVLCFDEFDAFAPSRKDLTNSNQSGEVNEFLTQLNNCSERGIFVVATTNRPERIDAAILRTGRIDKMIYVPLPDAEARKAMFEINLKGRPAEQLDIDELVAMTDNYVSSDIAYIVNDAATMAAFADEPITQRLLKDTISCTTPSVTAEQLAEYEELFRRFSTSRPSSTRRPIGYKKG